MVPSFVATLSSITLVGGMLIATSRTDPARLKAAFFLFIAGALGSTALALSGSAALPPPPGLQGRCSPRRASLGYLRRSSGWLGLWFDRRPRLCSDREPALPRRRANGPRHPKRTGSRLRAKLTSCAHARRRFGPPWGIVGPRSSAYAAPSRSSLESKYRTDWGRRPPQSLEQHRPELKVPTRVGRPFPAVLGLLRSQRSLLCCGPLRTICEAESDLAQASITFREWRPHNNTLKPCGAVSRCLAVNVTASILHSLTNCPPA
jgi:hypothetical protein